MQLGSLGVSPGLIGEAFVRDVKACDWGEKRLESRFCSCGVEGPFPKR